METLNIKSSTKLFILENDSKLFTTDNLVCQLMAALYIFYTFVRIFIRNSLLFDIVLIYANFRYYEHVTRILRLRKSMLSAIMSIGIICVEPN